MSSCHQVLRPIGGSFTHEPFELTTKLSSKAKKLLDQVFSDIDLSCLSDFHVHAVGVGANGTGAYVNPHMQSIFHPWKYLQYLVYTSASGIKTLKNADKEYFERLIELAKADPRYGKIHLLAFDYHYNLDGTKNLERSTFYIPNCSIMNEHAFYIGLLAATTFAILDRMFPDIVNECHCNGCNMEHYSNSRIKY